MTAANRMQARISLQNRQHLLNKFFYTDIQNIERSASNLSDDNLNHRPADDPAPIRGSAQV
jgi:hypothetical protein